MNQFEFGSGSWHGPACSILGVYFNHVCILFVVGVSVLCILLV